MASILNNVFKGITPPPFENTVEYDGLEFRWKMFVFRPAIFEKELYILGGVLFIVLVVIVGASVNSRRAKKWFSVHAPILEKQFSRPTVDGLISDGYSDLFNFSTGRKNVSALHTIFKLRPLHDPTQMIYQFLYGLYDLNYSPQDEIQLDFTLAPGFLPLDFVWAVTSKEELKSIKDERWDLTFTRASENSALPPSVSVMAEYADITESMLKSTPIASLLADSNNLKYFRSLSVTDQPRDRPISPKALDIHKDSGAKHVILTLRLPSSAKETEGIVSAVFGFVDSLNKLSLRPETKNKLKKTRENLVQGLKIEAEKEKKEEIAQAKEDERAKKRKEQEDKVAKLSAAEQQKLLEKERKKSMRKMQGKQVRK